MFVFRTCPLSYECNFLPSCSQGVYIHPAVYNYSNPYTGRSTTLCMYLWTYAITVSTKGTVGEVDTYKMYSIYNIYNMYVYAIVRCTWYLVLSAWHLIPKIRNIFNMMWNIHDVRYKGFFSKEEPRVSPKNKPAARMLSRKWG